MTLVVVPARAGSKGLPGKNGLQIGRVPLFNRAAAAAKYAKMDVVVSTDCPNYQADCLVYGVKYIDRPANLSDDYATVQDVAQHAIDTLEYTGSHVIIALPTTPFTTAGDLLEVRANCPVGGWALTVTHTDDFIMQDGKTVTPTEWGNRQQLPSRYRITGGAYCYDVKALKDWRKLYYDPKRTHLVVVPKERGLDINDKEDYEYAVYQSERSPTLCDSFREDVR